MAEGRDPCIRIGPAGWSYEDWKGIVYALGSREHPLEWLSAAFDTIEINTTFYRPASARNCQAWVSRVERNPNFKFTVKLWNRFTHERQEQPGDCETRLFKDGTAPVLEAGRLGALLIQFPWSFKRTPENRAWMARVLDAFSEYPRVVEVRHASWNRPEVYQGLAERNVAFCNIDQPLFHGSIQPMAKVTARIGYVRLHGRNAADWFREDAGRDDRYNYLYSEEELKPWIEKVERMRAQVDEVFVITNNHYRGQAIVNAFELLAGMGQREFALPRHLIEQYPRLERIMNREDA